MSSQVRRRPRTFGTADAIRLLETEMKRLSASSEWQDRTRAEHFLKAVNFLKSKLKSRE
jgi:hypothetical protein